MHISDPNSFLSSTAAALKKRKRDVFGGGTWNQENSLQGNVSQYQLDFQDINMLAASPPRCSIGPASPQTSWLHLPQSQPGIPEIQKKRRILQPHSHNQCHAQQQQHQQLRPHSGSPPTQTAVRRPPPPALMIPFFDHRRDAESLSSMPAATDEYEAVSPRTMTVSSPGRDVSSALPPPVLRPCHVCHRKPSTKVMLDAYADCELCGQRACYICLRECNSLNCRGESATTTPDADDDYDMMHYADIRREDGYLHTRPQSRVGPHSLRQRKVCSCCAVEGLTDNGEEIVWCLDCVRREETSR